MQRLISFEWFLAASFVFSACSLEVDDPLPVEGPAEVSLEALRAPSSFQGPLWFGTRVQAELTRAAAVHAFEFELGAEGEVGLATMGSSTGPDLDTVLSLYRVKSGAKRLVARNDDHEHTPYAALRRLLPRGRYRVEVQGKTRQLRGPYVLEAMCDGSGCPLPEPAEACVFGTKISQIGRVLRTSTVLSVASAAQLPDPLAAQQLVLSASHTPASEVMSADGLFRRVDQGLVRWFRVWDDRAGRSFRGFTYQLANRTFGAIFADGELDAATRIDAGELTACNVAVSRCRFGETYGDLKINPAFELQSARVVDAGNAEQLTSLEQSQLVTAVQVAYEDVVDLSSALASVDQSEVNHLRFAEPSTGLTFVAYEYGAGDNSYGGVFEADSVELAARINDGDLLACSTLE
ncbi:MAG: hypothetical protein QM778_01965 [Myxococcales bacterium]